MTINIDLAALGGGKELRVLSGKEKGQHARALFNLDAIDEANERVRITAPASLYAINTSFFLGLFAPSVLRLGGIDAFYQRYSFALPQYLLTQVQRALDLAVADRKPIVAAA